LISFLRKRGKILITHSLVNQLQCVMLKLWLNNPNVLQFMKNLHWLMSSLLLESTLLIWLEIQAIVLKFRNTRLINKMKLEGHTLIWGHIKVWCLNIRWLVKKHPRRFQSHWFKSYQWLEYSEKNTAFYFPCYLFSSKSSGKSGSDTFTVKGFNCWKKVNDGERYAFLTHMGKGPNSAHRFATRCLENLKNQSCYIEKVVKRQTTQEILNNQLRIKASIDIVR